MGTLDDAIICAAKNGQSKRVRQLIALGADIDSADDGTGGTALMHAAENGHHQCLRLLIKAGANVNARDKENGTALIWAAALGQHICAVMLLTAGADLDAQDNTGLAALDHARHCLGEWPYEYTHEGGAAHFILECVRVLERPASPPDKRMFMVPSP